MNLIGFSVAFGKISFNISLTKVPVLIPSAKERVSAASEDLTTRFILVELHDIGQEFSSASEMNTK